MHISRTAHLISFTLIVCIVEGSMKCGVKFGLVIDCLCSSCGLITAAHLKINSSFQTGMFRMGTWLVLANSQTSHTSRRVYQLTKSRFHRSPSLFVAWKHLCCCCCCVHLYSFCPLVRVCPVWFCCEYFHVVSVFSCVDLYLHVFYLAVARWAFSATAGK